MHKLNPLFNLKRAPSGLAAGGRALFCSGGYRRRQPLRVCNPQACRYPPNRAVGCKTTATKSSTFLNWSIETLLVEGVIKECTTPDHEGNTMYALTEAYDAATQQWGGGWRMPTVAECKELVTECTWTAYRSGSKVQGYTITGPNGNSITIECAGYYTGKGNYIEPGILSLWTSTPYVDNPVASYYLGDGYVTYGNRYCGMPIRPVYPKLTVHTMY